MQNLLRREEKRIVRKCYGGNPLYKTLNASCKEYECGMTVFRLSPEDVFAETMAVLDRIREEPDGAEELCRGLWGTLLCEYRDVCGGDAPAGELPLAVCIVMMSVAVCVNALDTVFHTRLVRELLQAMNGHYPLWHGVRHTMTGGAAGMDDLKAWIGGYMAGDDFLTDEDGCLYMPGADVVVLQKMHELGAEVTEKGKTMIFTYVNSVNGTVNGDAKQTIAMPQPLTGKQIEAK